MCAFRDVAGTFSFTANRLSAAVASERPADQSQQQQQQQIPFLGNIR